MLLDAGAAVRVVVCGRRRVVHGHLAELLSEVGRADEDGRRGMMRCWWGTGDLDGLALQEREEQVSLADERRGRERA